MIMRHSIFALALLALAGSGQAKKSTAPVVAAPAPQPVIDPLAERISALESQLQQAGAEIQRLRAIEAMANEQRPIIEQLKTKNEALVSIGLELVAAHERRYRRGLKDPFEFGRRKFEAEAQDFADRFYGKRHDVPVRPAEKPLENGVNVPAPDIASHKTETNSQ